MSKTFVIADTHFGHKKILTFEAEHRPFATIEEHDAAIVERWNAVVGPHDLVWHLGDVLFGRPAFASLARLNGIKKLVMGNHDQYASSLYLEHFARIAGCAEYGGAILTHIPVHHSQFSRYAVNIHGHTHHRSIPDDPRYICVSAEHNNLTPVLLDSLLPNGGRNEFRKSRRQNGDSATGNRGIFSAIGIQGDGSAAVAGQRTAAVDAGSELGREEQDAATLDAAGAGRHEDAPA